MHFIKNPNLPNNSVSLAVVDGRINKEIEDELKLKKIEIIKTCQCVQLYSSIQYHPDIVMTHLGENNIVIAPNVYDYYMNKLGKYNFNLIKGTVELHKAYPNNIAYNIVFIGRHVIHNFDFTEKNIMKHILSNNYNLINVKQGYTKCSVSVVDHNSIITSDKGIHKEVVKNGIDSLLIRDGDIELFDMNYGFIGGASGLLNKKEIGFYGDINQHIDCEKITSYLKEKNISIINLGKGKLTDYGSIISLLTREE